MLIILFLFTLTATQGQHPIPTDIYAADPAAHVFNDTLYIYPSHDIEGARWFDMRDWHVLSTTDMKTWTDHGVALSLDSVRWARKYAWAPDCAYKNGKYYFYYPVDRDAIGVAVSDRPYGPFHDPLGKALVTRQTPGVVESRSLIDPCVFTDDDGAAYLVFGQNEVNIVRLNENMISFSDTVRQIRGVDHFFEAVWMHKYNGKYYISYSGRGKILYGMGDSPYGPFTYRGVVLGKVNSVTNHASITLYKGQWYLFYHTSDKYIRSHKRQRVSLKKYYSRSTCAEPLYYNADGTIRRVVSTGIKRTR